MKKMRTFDPARRASLGRYTLVLVVGLFSAGLQQGIAQALADTAAILSNARTISLLGKHYGDSVVLRWAPTQPEYWYANLHRPVLIARRQVAPVPGEYEIISDSIRLMPEQALEPFAAANPDHPLLVVLLQNAYRDWDNSLYDGNPATMLEKAENFRNRWSLTLFAADQDPVVAQAAGLRFVDKDIQDDVTYAYKIFLPGQLSGADHKVVYPRIREFTPMIYQGFQRDSALVIQWQRRMHDAHYSAYHIERSADGKIFERLTALPYVQAYSNDPQLQSYYYTYTDRVANGQTYAYRLRGIDAFGDISAPSQPVTLQARDLRAPAPPVVDTRVDSIRKGVQVTWTYPDSLDAHQVVVLYAEGGEAPEPISGLIPASTTSYLHQPGDFNGLGQYAVSVLDTNGNASLPGTSVIRIPDFVAPSRPGHVHAVTDTTGLIRMRWDEATEQDVIGYFVYAADGPQRHFTRLTPKLYPFRQFTDTVDVHTLTEKRYYYVIAVDDAFNYSAPSDTLAVERPDVTPPAPAWIQSFAVTDSSVILHLVPSSSRDVIRHALLRKTPGESQWSEIAALDPWPAYGSYEDVTTGPGQRYVYTLIAYDEKGLASVILAEKHVTTRMNRSIDVLQPTLIAAADGMAVVRWEPHESVSAVKVYTKQKNQWTLFEEVSAPSASIELPAYAGAPVMVKAVFTDGSLSAAKILNP